MAPYDWSTLKTNPKIHETFVIQLNNRFAFLQESVSAPSVNSTYDNFETACRETAKNTIPLKLKTKKRKPWESADICQKRHKLHTAAQLKNSLPSHENVKKFKDTRAALKSSYEAEQTEYLQSKINHIRTTASKKRLLKHGRLRSPSGDIWEKNIYLFARLSDLFAWLDNLWPQFNKLRERDN